MAHSRKSKYAVEPGESYPAWRLKHFDDLGNSRDTGEPYEEPRLENMFWFRSQRYAAPTKSPILTLARA